MEKLTDFNPLTSIALPNIGHIKPRGLVVAIGPNSVGKTQMLKDIQSRVLGQPRNLVVCEDIALMYPPDLYVFLNVLYKERHIRRRVDSNNNVFIDSAMPHLGSNSGNWSIIENDVNRFFRRSTTSSSDGQTDRFLEHFGRFFLSSLFLERRLVLTTTVDSFDYETQVPANELQALYLSETAQDALASEAMRVFNKAVWLDNTRGNKLCLRVADDANIPSDKDMRLAEKMQKYRLIEDEGDGFKSYIGTCVTLLLGQRPICLIDEPELCLHPPQAYALGRFIGRYGSSTDRVTFVATHSSHVLRGMLETNSKTHVIRLNRASSTFQSQNLSPDILDQAISKPRSRSEAVLEGLLSHGAVLCEAEGDRMVYESTYRTLKDRRLDIRFIPSEGTGGFADPLRLYKALKVPSVVVTDIDFLAKDGELRRVLTELGTPEAEVKGLCDRARQAITEIKSCVSPLNPDEIQKDIQKLAKAPIDLSQNEDIRLQRNLRNIADRLSRLRDLQELGIEAIPEEYNNGKTKKNLRQEVKNILDELQKYGLFLVPVGELESWLPVLMKGQSREDKSKWAMLAAEKIEDVGERNEDVWQFIRSVYDFLQGQLGASVGVSP